MGRGHKRAEGPWKVGKNSGMEMGVRLKNSLYWTADGNELEVRMMMVITFLPRSKRLLISWLQSPSAVILEPKKKKINKV